MPPPPRKASYRSDMFDVSTLTSIEAVENALFELQGIINAANVGRILDDIILHERPAVVRLTGLDDELVMSQFPTSSEAFTGSLASKILSQLSFFFLSAQKVPGLHENHQQLVKDAPEVLGAIASRQVADGLEPKQESSGFKKKPANQRKAKMARLIAAQDKLDSAPFDRLKISVPETREEIGQCIELLLATQRSILKAYLESLRLPAVAASVKATCIPAEPVCPAESEEESSDSEALGAGSGDGPQNPQTNDSASAASYPAVQPIKFSTLYRRRATGFGDWSINIAPRAERDLREYSRRDRRTFILVVKKMRELSNGDFSPENYSQLNGSNVEIPIYEATVSEDLRLVYQVDSVPVYGTKTEQQALKVFGIYEKAQLSRGSFWDSMGRELGKKGEEYKERCIQRQNTEGCIFVPVAFPTQEDARFNPGSVPDLPSDDAEQIQSLLLKSPLLDSIIADLDVAFVLEISYAFRTRTPGIAIEFRSPKELEIIEHPNSCYVLGRSGTGKTTSMLYKMLLIEASSELSTPETRKSRQLFVTQSRMLADKVREYFAKLLGGYQPSAISENFKAARRADRALVDVEESDWRTDLPKKYSDLQDTDFPLFVSFDQLCTMIEHDMQSSGYRADSGGTTRLTYAKFRREYWPHFSHSACKGFEPSMVFSEFMGVIMGSEKALASKTYCLDREVYLNLGERGQSTFGDQRERIYDLFEKYSSQKRRQGGADPADRSHEIIKFFGDHGVPGKKVDYFSFRFNELKAFLHRVEERRRKKHPELSFQPVAPPRPFQLTVNYRSHTGIINCAHSVIEVITKLWPDAIDSLDRERGTVDGLRPIFFINWNSENVQSKQFLFGDKSSSGYIELGAQQCILVRNDTAKEDLRKQVGDIGLIMTLYESKGLEFNDVFIYNFFEDSGLAEAQWRVVLNVMDKRTNDGTPSAPIFDKMRHASVCTELKFLYVAITRARNNIWIADCSTKDAVDEQRPGAKLCARHGYPRFAISSTPAEWQEQGRKLFDSKRFSQAKLCYERASMPHEATVSHAYHLREEASGMPHNHRHEIAARRTAFLQVAATFLGCARNERAKNAAETYFRRAGECFEDAEDFNQAIDAYNHAKYFSRVAELYLDMGKIDQAVATVKNYDRDINPNVSQRVISVARLLYFKKAQFEKAGRLFDGHEKALAYLEDRGLNLERANFLEWLGKFSDAAEVHLEEGRTLRAIQLFLKDQNTARASECVLHGFWEKLSFAVVPHTQDSLVSHLLDLAAQIDVSLVSRSTNDEISMFRAIASREVDKLLVASESTNEVVILLCLDHYFVNSPEIQAHPVDAVAGSLRVFHAYVKLLHHFAFTVDPCSSSAAEKLFGYKREGKNNYSIPQGTFLYRAQPNRPSEANILLTGSELQAIFRRSLSGRLAERCNHDNCPQEHILASSFSSQEYTLRVRIHLQQMLIYQTLHNIDADDSERRYWISRLYAVLNPPSYQLGPASSLDLSLIPEAETGLQIAKQWIQSWAYTLEFVPELEFLTHVVQLGHLGFQLAGRHAMSYLTRVPFIMNPKKPLISEGRYVVADFLLALDNQHPLCLVAGVTFFHHIITSRRSIYVEALCDVAEYLCARLVVADCLRFGPVHDITLPLSWLGKIFSVGEGNGPAWETHTFRLFAESLSALLELLYSGFDVGHLLCESKNLADATLGDMIQDVFLARICLCLLAHNFRNDWLTEYVLNSITSLGRKDPDHRFTLCTKYVDADSLISLIRSSTEGSSLDEMVQLLHISRSPLCTICGVRQIRYTNIEDIPRLLGASSLAVLTSSSPYADEPTAALQTEMQQGFDDAPDDGDAVADQRLFEDVPLLPSVPEPVARSKEELAAAVVGMTCTSMSHIGGT
ncbi:hypothetical protein B0H13DRAFT_2364932 [Mycena leptocephala]|nr:hypothetical protein B0H13DRAFT_2364932 [Mycena leptocephala]